MARVWTVEEIKTLILTNDRIVLQNFKFNLSFPNLF